MHIPNRRLAFLTALFLGATALVSPARAEDPPARVGRVSYAEGAVSFHVPDQSQWSFAAINYPVTAGESFWADADGRNEIEIGSSTLRMDHSTEINVLQLTAAVTQIQIDQGAINYRLGALAPGETVEIETPHGAVSLIQPGTYHIEAGDDTHPALIATLEGDARFIGQQSYLDVETGEQATAIGQPVSYTMAEAQPNAFDNWALQRDQREHQSQTIRYVSPETTGYQALDNYGTWQSNPQYGEVWTPSSVPAGWAPYHQGHWAWVEPWGWTWIDDQPWGFAPFHYGRWANVNNGWVWVPGGVVAQPVYAPALVAFSAPPPDAGVAVAGFAAAAIAWLALAPNEVYYPPYGPSAAYVRAVNGGGVSRAVLNGIHGNHPIGPRTFANYANQRSATMVPQQVFANGQAVQHAAVAPPANLSTLRVAGTLAPIRPTPAARAAAATVPASGAPEAARGPAQAREHAEEREIHAAAPQTLSTVGKDAPVVPSVSGPGRVREESVSRPVAPTVAGPQASTAARPEENRAEPERNAAATEAHAPFVREASVEQHPATAPGPAIHAPAPSELRQRTLEASLKTQATPAAPRTEARPAAAAATRTEPAAAAPARAAPAPQRAAPAPFHPAAVAKPAQTAPLRPSPQGWNRAAPRAPEPTHAAEPKPGEPPR